MSTTLVPALPLLPHETVYAIDPGNFETAYFLLKGDGTFGHFAKIPNADFLANLRTAVTLNWEGIVTRPIFACEMVGSYGMAVGASVFETCVMIGRIQEIVGPHLRLIPRSSVKSTIKGRNDSEIRTRLIEQFGPPGTKKKPGKTYGVVADMWAALALAETVRRGGYKPYIFSYDKKHL
jgi:hypothetical protein